MYASHCGSVSRTIYQTHAKGPEGRTTAWMEGQTDKPVKYSMVLLYRIHDKQLEQLDSRCGSIIANHTPLSFLIQCLFLV